MKIHKYILISLSCILIATGSPGAEEPLNALKEPVERVLTILKNHNAQPGGDLEKQKQELFEATKDIFDYMETSKRALGRNWLGRTGGELLLEEDVLRERLEAQEIYLALGLSRGYQDQIWLLVIGVHVVPDYEMEIDYENL